MFAQVTVEGSANTFGDAQLSVDVIADEIMWEVAKGSEVVAYGASEEEPEIVKCNPKGEYTICWDPLDGSSIVDNNWAVGTIIGVFVLRVLCPFFRAARRRREAVTASPRPQSHGRSASWPPRHRRDASSTVAPQPENPPLRHRPRNETRTQVGLEVRQGRRRLVGRHRSGPGHILGGFVRPAHDGRRGFR